MTLENRKICIECGEEKEMFEGTEIKEPKMCIGCYASMVGFIYNEDTETFHEMDEIFDN